VAVVTSLTVFDVNGCGGGTELTVEIALTAATGLAGLWDVGVWDVDLWGPDVVWQDVSQWVRSVETDRKFDSRMRTWQAGTFTVVLDNRDGRFSPDNLDPAAPYVVAGISGVRPGCPARIHLTYAGITYPLFWGYCTSWDEGWALHEPREGDAYMTVAGVDVWGWLGRAKGHEVGAVGAGESFGARVARLLTAAGFTAGMALDTGVTTMQATTLADDRIAEINKTAQSEGGLVWAEADGTIVARDRYALMEDARSTTVQAMFGDGPGEIPWESITKAPVAIDAIINSAEYKRDDPAATPQSFGDAVSIALYGVRGDPDTSTDLVNETDAQVLALAQWSVLVNRDPEARVEELTLRPRCDLATLAPILLALMIADLVTVTVRPPSATGHIMTRDCFVSGISHAISENDWVMRVRTASATAWRAFAESRWDTGLWGASDVDLNGARWFV
jgi:hypothetical protein